MSKELIVDGIPFVARLGSKIRVSVADGTVLEHEILVLDEDSGEVYENATCQYVRVLGSGCVYLRRRGDGRWCHVADRRLVATLLRVLHGIAEQFRNGHGGTGHLSWRELSVCDDAEADEVCDACGATSVLDGDGLDVWDRLDRVCDWCGFPRARKDGKPGDALEDVVFAERDRLCPPPGYDEKTKDLLKFFDEQDRKCAMDLATERDITEMHVEAIVNAANSELAGGCGVDGAIHRAAGPDLDRACAEIGYCAPGDAAVTPGFWLHAKYVIHTVAPVWRGGGHGELKILRSCYWNSLEIAKDLGLSTVAFPCLGTGVYGIPKDLACREATDVVAKWLKERNDMKERSILFCTFEDEDRRLYEAALEEWRKTL